MSQKWPQPSEEEVLKLAKILTPFVRFLKPEIIREITEDNCKHQAEWSNKLEECEIDPKIYLWERSPCAFPGIRRYSGSKEIAMFRKHRESNRPFEDCIEIDDNSFPKQLWAFVFTGWKFNNHGPKDYRLAHLFDHKNNTKRYQEETEGWNRNTKKDPKLFGLFTRFKAAFNPILVPKKDPKLFGLFTCPTNTVYSPAIFIKPTDFSPKLRTLLQRKAYDLYKDVCQVLPHELEVADCNDPKWDIKNFEWSEPVGDITYVKNFLDFRYDKIDKLFEKYHSKWLDVVPLASS